jgi:HEAT repeat protein
MQEILTKEEMGTVIEGLSSPGSPEYEEALGILRKLSESVLAALLRTLMDDPDAGLALGVARAVGMTRCRTAVDVVMALVEEPGKWFGHTDRTAIRMAAIESLGVLRNPAGVEILLDLIGSTRDAEMQLQAVRALGEIGSPDSTIPLIAHMKTTPAIALSAAGALVQIGGEEAFMGLIAGLSDDEEMVQSACVWALGKMGDQRAVGPLVKLAIRSDAFLRRDIAWALGEIGGLKSRAALGELCCRDPDIGVRREASRAIKSGAVTKRHLSGNGQ